MDNVEKTHLGIDVLRIRPGMIELTAHTDHEKEYLLNAFVKMSGFCITGYCPIPYIYRRQEGVLVMEDLGMTEPVTNDGIFRKHIANMIIALKRHHIIHGDATDKNLVVRNNKPHLVDFQQSRYEYEPGPDKREGGDAKWLWLAADKLSPTRENQ